ncbi:MAG: hypothetical protein K8S16_19945, partial [Bacteroidales bacterium]|nr:hypothetical protein [Bacteroidales bacterium]
SEDGTYHPTELIETLSSLKNSPLNINNASHIELTQLPWLSELDIGKIIKARNKKPISGWKELQNIGISEITISEIKNYIIFIEKPWLKLNQRTRGEYSECKDNYESTLKYYQRTLFQYDKFRFGFLSQKDEGEKDPFDFYSYFAEYKSNSSLKHSVLGKYRLAVGQGILFAPKLGMSKSSAATSVAIKKFKTIKPYTSSYEIWELEGAAVNIELGNFAFIPFYSSTKLSANLDSLSQITSFNESGLHLDVEKKDNVKETIYGSSINYKFKDNSLGFVYSGFKFDHEFNDPQKAAEYNAIGFNFLLNQNTFPTFGELAQADDKLAGLIGTKFGDNKLRHLILFRYYEKNFPTWHGNPFSTQSKFDNEIGLYYGITLVPFSRTKINCYFDLWNFPETRYFEKMPTVGSEQFLQVETRFKTNTLRLTLQHKDKEKYISLEETRIRDFERTLLRADWWQILGNLRLKTRCELAAEYLEEEKIYSRGILIYEQAKLKWEKLQIIAQITAYRSDTQPFNVKHYVYENNVDGIMQNTVLSGDGICSYFLIKWKLPPHFELQFKISDHWHMKDKMKLYQQVVSRF